VLIPESILDGREGVRAQGVKTGRPSKLNEAVRTSVKLLRDGGMGIKKISTRLEIGVGSVYGALQASLQSHALSRVPTRIQIRPSNSQ